MEGKGKTAPKGGKRCGKMLNKEFIEFLYEAAHIQRWNDHIRPNGFTELDKQAHKMIISTCSPGTRRRTMARGWTGGP